MIQELYEERSDLLILSFEAGLAAEEIARFDYLTALINRWQAIRDRVYGLRLWAWEVTRENQR